MELIWMWVMGAAHSSDGSKSILSMDLEPILAFDPTFTEWTSYGPTSSNTGIVWAV
jgi:hypothetical protein